MAEDDVHTEEQTEELPVQEAPTEELPAQRPRVQVTISAPGRRFVYSFLVLLLLVGVAAGAFFIGQSTRKSDGVVAREKASAVKLAVSSAVPKAVAAAVAKKGADDKAARLRIMHRDETRMNAEHRVEVKKLQRVATRKAATAYASGSAVGRQQGYTDGVDDGYGEGYDDAASDGACSDDPDVALPYC